MSIEEYKQASRVELETVIERFAKVEQAADLQPGSIVQGLLSSFIDETDGAEIVARIRCEYDLIAASEDWEARIMELYP